MPYFEILEKWIYKGIICDPYSEVRTHRDTEILPVHVTRLLVLNILPLCWDNRFPMQGNQIDLVTIYDLD